MKANLRDKVLFFSLVFLLLNDAHQLKAEEVKAENLQFIFEAKAESYKVNYPEPIVINVSLLANDIPISNAHIEAEVIKPNQEKKKLIFVEGCTKNLCGWPDGRFIGIFADYSGDGIYKFKIKATNQNNNARLGPMSMCPPSMLKDGEANQVSYPAQIVGQFEKEVDLEINLSNYSTTDLVVPGQIRRADLQLMDENNLAFTWELTGDNAYSGEPKLYEIRKWKVKEVRPWPDYSQMWQEAEVVIQLTPQEASSKYKIIGSFMLKISSKEDLRKNKFLISAQDKAGNWNKPTMFFN